MKNITTIAMMGKPGSGKGTQAKLLAEKLDFKLFSSGDTFRTLKKEDSPLGRKVKNEIDNGYLMPHWFASYLFENIVLNIPRKEGVVFEGPGRKLPEAELFENVMNWLERPYRAINLNVDEDEIIKRLTARAKNEDRGDDNPEAVKLRFEEYNKYTALSVAYFKSLGKLIEINGMQDMEKVELDIIEALKSEDETLG